MENSPKSEDLYKQAEDTRDFKNLGINVAGAILKEIGQLLHLPAPLPGQTAAEWQQLTNETRQVDLQVAEAWWQLHTNLVDSVQFVMPNKARSVKDETTRTWTRKAGHFVLRLKFGAGSLLTQQALQGKLGEQLEPRSRT